MKTEDLVTLLATRVEAVDRFEVSTRRRQVLGGGVVVSVVFTLSVLHLNPALPSLWSQPMFWVREIYCGSLGWVALLAVRRLAIPGRQLRLEPLAAALVVIGMWGVAFAIMYTASPAQRTHLLFGKTAAVCSPLIALIATPVFLSLLWILRDYAPTELRLSGGAAGFSAGAIGALIYTLHCPELGAPFIGIWYLLGMLIPAAVGVWTGPALLRW